MDKPAQWALVGAAWFLALSVALLGFFAFRHFEAKSAPATAANAGSIGELALGASAIDPVTGATLTVGADTPHLIYQDRVYYFSDLSDAAGLVSKRRFVMDPESYVHPGLVPNLSTQAAIADATAVASAPKGLPTPLPTAIPTPLPTVAPTLHVTAHP